MANYSSLIDDLKYNIRSNGDNNITGQILQDVLINMVRSLGAGFNFIGAASSNMNPGTPDYNVVYLAGPGNYPLFNNLTVEQGKLGILKYNGNWILEQIEIGGGGSGGGGGDYHIDTLFLPTNGKIVFGNNALTDPFIEYIGGTTNQFHFSRGIYSDGSITAGGVGSDGGSGGGGGTTLNQPLSAINSAGLGAPSDVNVGLKWNGTSWEYASWGGGVSWGASGVDYVPLTVNGVTKNILTAHQSLSGYATQSWVTNKNYATQSWITAQGYATQSWITSKGYLTSESLSGYATQSWVTSKNYLTSAVTSLNELTGAVTLSNGSNVSITKSGSTITIAATNTTYKLSLNGNTNGDSASGISLGTFYAPTTSGTAGYSLVAGGTNTAPFWSSLLFHDTTNNRIGIGTTSPSYKLDVSGTIHSTENIYAGGSLYIGGTTAYLEYVSANSGIHSNVGIYSSSYIAAGTTSVSSDIRLKKDIKSISSDKALSVIKQLKPKEWTWNKNSALFGKQSAGLIAQDVQNILPDAVIGGDYLSLNYNMLHAYEIAVLQNYKERIEVLEKENYELKNRVNYVSK